MMQQSLHIMKKDTNRNANNTSKENDDKYRHANFATKQHSCYLGERSLIIINNNGSQQSQLKIHFEY